MKTLFDSARRKELTDRLRRLTAQHTRRWGRMSAHRMINHVADQLRMALGEIPSRERRTMWRNPLLSYVMIFWLPWPKGKAKAPREGFTTQPTEWSADVQTLVGLIEQFSNQAITSQWPVHPLFGRLSGRAWGVLSYRHLDHHLRQFGV